MNQRLQPLRRLHCQEPASCSLGEPDQAAQQARHSYLYPLNLTRLRRRGRGRGRVPLSGMGCPVDAFTEAARLVFCFVELEWRMGLGWEMGNWSNGKLGSFGSLGWDGGLIGGLAGTRVNSLFSFPFLSTGQHCGGSSRTHNIAQNKIHTLLCIRSSCLLLDVRCVVQGSRLHDETPTLVSISGLGRVEAAGSQPARHWHRDTDKTGRAATSGGACIPPSAALHSPPAPGIPQHSNISTPHPRVSRLPASYLEALSSSSRK